MGQDKEINLAIIQKWRINLTSSFFSTRKGGCSVSSMSHGKCVWQCGMCQCGMTNANQWICIVFKLKVFGFKSSRNHSQKSTNKKVLNWISMEESMGHGSWTMIESIQNNLNFSIGTFSHSTTHRFYFFSKTTSLPSQLAQRTSDNSYCEWRSSVWRFAKVVRSHWLKIVNRIHISHTRNWFDTKKCEDTQYRKKKILLRFIISVLSTQLLHHQVSTNNSPSNAFFIHRNKLNDLSFRLERDRSVTQ